MFWYGKNSERPCPKKDENKYTYFEIILIDDKGLAYQIKSFETFLDSVKQCFKLVLLLRTNFNK